MALARSMLISDFCETCYVKPSYRIIIDHINHIPHGRDAADRLNEEFVVLEKRRNRKNLPSRMDPDRRDCYRGETPRLHFSADRLSFAPRESLRSHRPRRGFVRKRQPAKMEPVLGKR